MTTFQKYILTTTASIALMAHAGMAMAQDAPIVQPGAPGKPAQALDAKKAIEIANNSYSTDDVQFMQDMIPHHNQAVQMAALVASRTNTEELIEIAGRIDASQADEIRFMSQWLAARGENVPEPTAHEGMNMSHEMAGMASPTQMAALAAANATDFDRMFLELMIAHHKGAITMVNDLLSHSGSAYDPVLFDFVSDITNDQTSEIKRMTGLLVGLSNDPRAGLAAGFDDAGEAAMNVALIATLPRPAGFFDPDNPSDLPPVIESDDEAGETDEEADVKRGERSPFLSFSNTDMAFSGDKLVVGSYHGFNVYQLQEGGTPKLYSSVVCPGGQGDISIVGDLLIMSVEQTRGRVDCGRQGISEDVSADRFRGLRIFDISDLARPRQVGQVQTCRGSHTHSVVSGPGKDGKIVVYNSGTSSVRSEEELAGCVGRVPGDERTALFRIDVIEIPVDNPANSRIVDSPAVFADQETGRIAGLWQGGDHGANTQDTSETDQCHDITVFPEAKIAAGACSGNGIIFDISDPLKPTRIDVVTDPGFAYWHSATFNNDGTKVLFTDEWGGGGRPRCLAHDPKTWGANVFYDIVDRKLEYRGRFKLPAPQSETENCVAHNGSAVPVPGRDIFVQAWYQGGVSVIDFTDSTNPQEIAFFDRGPIHEDVLVTGGFWSAYWYNGKIYGSEIVRGLDVMALLPSEYLTENEIAAASIADQGTVFNPQQQFRVSWPADPVVARAYIDQLQRSNALSASTVSNLTTALDRSQASLEQGSRDANTANQLTTLATALNASEGNAKTQERLASLGETLNGIAAKLR
ncbi:DUF305 domain-containing protein [Kordiimonas aquimaris]|uniref:DUF305 domain-containing protein n=1 Tax=Kordiimonas aquimaris TaxID=707591 RepID=UPI0021D1FEE6|nr:DUF305 domain-containing protein [Kordiimonas aquimaris]